MPTLLRTILLALALLALASCTSDATAPADGPGEGQPGVAGDSPIDAELADLPVPDAADAVGEETDRDGVQTQSYILTATQPEQVVDFYVDALPDLGWTMESQTALDEGIRATWTQDGDELLVTASPDGQDTSLNLQLSGG